MFVVFLTYKLHANCIPVTQPALLYFAPVHTNFLLIVRAPLLLLFESVDQKRKFELTGSYGSFCPTVTVAAIPSLRICCCKLAAYKRNFQETGLVVEGQRINTL